MAMRWTSLMLALGWFGTCAAAMAQPAPAPGPGAPAFPFLPDAPACPAPAAGQAAADMNSAAANAPACDAGGPQASASIAICGEADSKTCHGLQYTVGLEYLLWYTRPQSLPPLVTAGSLSDPFPAALGQPHTQLLFGGDRGDANQHNGGRASFDISMDEDDPWCSVAGSAFYLDQHAVNASFGNAGGAGDPVIGRPFFNLNSGLEDADPVAIPNIASGSITISTPSQVYGGDLDVRLQGYGDACNRLSLLLGGRYLAVDEGLNITETSQDLPGQGVQGNLYQLREDFGTRNRFFGGELGADYEWRLGPVSADFLGKAAFGYVRQTVNNSAFTSITEPDGTVTTSTDRALYIYPADAGKFTQSRFAVVPEGRFRLGVDLSQYVRVTAGYSFLYLSQAARPGDQANRNVNIQPVGTTAVFGPPQSPTIQSTGFWAQGLDAGLAISF